LAEKLFKNISLEDEKILSTLSEIGVFIFNYATGEILSSKIWKDMPDNFQVERENTNFLDYIHKDDRNRIKNALADIDGGRVSEFHEIFRVQNRNGSYKWVHSFGRTVNCTEDEKPLLFIGLDFDISDLKETEEKLRISIEQEKKKAEELETIRQIVSQIGSSLDMEETVNTTLKEIRRIIPYQTGSIQLLQGDYLSIIGAEGFENNKDICKLQFKYPVSDSLSTKALQDKKPIRSDDISQDFPSFTHPHFTKIIYSWMGIPLISHGEVIGLLALDGYEKNQFSCHHMELAEIIADHISIALENAMLHEKAYKMAMEDALTGIGNRHRFKMEGRLLFETAIRSETTISIAMLDIDHFKVVNDRFGHDKGDLVLKEIARICSREIRLIDLVARYGGEEFVLVLPGTGAPEAFTAVDRLRRIIEKSSHPEIQQTVTISGGIYSGVPVQNEKISKFLANADIALYKAKNSGRNKVCTFSE